MISIHTYHNSLYGHLILHKILKSNQLQTLQPCWGWTKTIQYESWLLWIWLRYWNHETMFPYQDKTGCAFCTYHHGQKDISNDHKELSTRSEHPSFNHMNAEAEAMPSPILSMMSDIDLVEVQKSYDVHPPENQDRSHFLLTTTGKPYVHLVILKILKLIANSKLPPPFT